MPPVGSFLHPSFHRRWRHTMAAAAVLLFLLVCPLMSRASAVVAPSSGHTCGSTVVAHPRVSSLPIAHDRLAHSMGEGSPSSPLLAVEQGYAGGPAVSPAPLRVKFFALDIANTSRHCTAAGDVRPTFTGATRRCSKADVLTSEKRRTLLEELVPRAIGMHTSRLDVVSPVVGNLFAPAAYHAEEVCSQFSVPEDHYTKGVADADLVLYIAAGPTEEEVTAWASTCAVLVTTGRPAFGVVNVSPRYIAAEESIVRVVAHEITHVLGFTDSFFEAAGMLANQTDSAGKEVIGVRSPAVVQVGREYFQDPQLEMVELENNGGEGTRLSHWKRRFLKEEMMAGMVGSAGYYTAFTLAALEDLQFYQRRLPSPKPATDDDVNGTGWRDVEPMSWGFAAGPAFLTQKCVSNGQTAFPSMFCVGSSQSAKLERQQSFVCDAERRAVGFCGLATFAKPLPAIYQYFSHAPSLGGTAPLMDYCPVVEPYENGGCSSGDPLALPGSIISPTARCLDAVVPGEEGDGGSASSLRVLRVSHDVGAICVEVKCKGYDNASLAEYYIQFGGQANRSEWVPCVENRTIEPHRYSKLFTAGSIRCPARRVMCSGSSSSTPLTSRLPYFPPPPLIASSPEVFIKVLIVLLACLAAGGLGSVAVSYHLRVEVRTSSRKGAAEHELCREEDDVDARHFDGHVSESCLLMAAVGGAQPQ